jgi:hypothetical protein
VRIPVPTVITELGGIGMDRLIEVSCAVVSAVWIYMGVFSYGFWTGSTPGGGFVPVLFGGLTLIFCLALLFKGRKKSVVVNRNVFFPVAVVAAAMVSTVLAGMIVTLLVMVFAWLKYYEKYSYQRAGVVAMVVVAFVFGIFGVWLQVPFPTGLLGI